MKWNSLFPIKLWWHCNWVAVKWCVPWRQVEPLCSVKEEAVDDDEEEEEEVVESGQAQENLAESISICGAGRHKWEQWPLSGWHQLGPGGCRYGWYTTTVIGFTNCSRNTSKSYSPVASLSYWYSSPVFNINDIVGWYQPNCIFQTLLQLYWTAVLFIFNLLKKKKKFLFFRKVFESLFSTSSCVTSQPNGRQILYLFPIRFMSNISITQPRPPFIKSNWINRNDARRATLLTLTQTGLANEIHLAIPSAIIYSNQVTNWLVVISNANTLLRNGWVPITFDN